MQRQHDLHHMGHTQSIHEGRDLLHGLTKEQLITMRAILITVVDGTVENNERGAYYIGRITEVLSVKHSLCPCGTDHDKESAALLDQPEAPATPQTRDDVLKIQVENALKDSDTQWTPAQLFLIDRIKHMAQAEHWTADETARAIEDGVKMLSEIWPNRVAEEPEPAPNTEPGPGPTRDELLKQYNVLEFPLQFPKVTCAKGCGTVWVSLGDRMMRPPGECSGCQNKEAWG